MLEGKQIREAIRTMDLAADESEQAVQDARAQFARVEALPSKLEEWRRPLTMGRRQGWARSAAGDLTRRRTPRPRDWRSFRR
jgi:hypothetical protein